MKNLFYSIIFALTQNIAWSQPTGTWYTSSSSPVKQLQEISGGTIYTYSVSSPTPIYGSPAYTGPSQEELTMYYNQQFSGYLEKQAYQDFNKGTKAYQKGKYNKAVNKFNRAYQSDPKVWQYKENLEKAKSMRDKQRDEARIKKQAEKINREFLTIYNKNIIDHNNELKHARKFVKSEVPVPGSKPKKIVQEGIMLGLFNYGSHHDGLKVVSPKSKKLFNSDQIYCTSDKNPFGYGELVRGVLDNLTIGEFTKMTPYGKELIQRLEGTHFNTLYAHSNGATLAEALILEGVMTVDELHVMGGDRSLANDEGYQRLIASGKVKKVVVWINPGDPVPILSSIPKMVKGSFKESHQALMTVVGIEKEKKYNKNSSVEYHYLKGEEYKGQSLFEPLVSHGLTTLFHNMNVHYDKKKY
jgi:hypothetical protein